MLAVQVMCEVPPEVQHSKVFRQLPLHSNRHKGKAHSKGSLDFAIWLGPTNDALSRMDEGTQLCYFCAGPPPPPAPPFAHLLTQPMITSGLCGPCSCSPGLVQPCIIWHSTSHDATLPNGHGATDVQPCPDSKQLAGTILAIAAAVSA